MLVVRSMGALALIAVVGVYTPVTVSAQQSTVVAHSVSVSEDGSSLEFELANGKTITIELADGTIRINGETAGAYGTGGELEASWRSLLSHGGPLSSPELLEALQGWEVDGLEGAEVQIQAAIAASLDNLDVVIANAMAAAQIAAAVEVQDAQERARALARSGTPSGSGWRMVASTSVTSPCGGGRSSKAIWRSSPAMLLFTAR